jgi:non-ribosomal peptide synthetase component F
VASHRGEHLPIELDAGLHQQLRQLGRRSGASLFMVLQAGLATLLTKLGAGSDIPIGSPIAGRTDQALDDLVGVFINTLVLRTNTSGHPTFRQLISQVRDTALAAYAHQDVPFEYVVQALNPIRSLAQHPLFQIVLALQSTPDADFQLPGLDTSPVFASTRTARVDLFFDLWEQHGPDGTPQGLKGVVEYATDLFDPATIHTLFTRWVRLLHTVVADPDTPISQLDLLSADERTQVLIDYNTTTIPIPATCLPVLFETQASATPQAPAVISGDITVSYHELNTSANQLAHALIAQGVGPEQIVALALPRDLDLVVAIVAVLKTGAAYLPIDPDYPPARIEFMLHDAHPALVLTTTHTAGCVPHDSTPQVVIDDSETITALTARPDTDPSDAQRTAALLAEHPAYVIYTSGSTGTPKGVVVSHAAITNLLAGLQDQYGLESDDRVLQKAS